MNYAIDVQGPEQILPCRRQGAGRCQSAGGRRRNGRLAGRVRFRQVDAAAPSGRFRRGRRGLGQRHGQWPADPASRQAQPAGARRARQYRFVFQQFNLVGRLPVITNVLTGMLPRVPLWRSLTRWFRRDEVRAGLDALCPSWYRRLCIPARLDPVRRPAAARRHRAHAGAERPRHPGRRADRLAGSRISRRVMDTLAQINRSRKVAVVVSLHQVDVALRYCPRVVALRHGKVVTTAPAPT